MRPITDRAEVAIDFPDKTFMGSFGHTALFAVRAEPHCVELRLAQVGTPKRTVQLHMHWYLFADILDELAASLEGRAGIVDDAHRDVLADAIRRLANAVDAAAGSASTIRAAGPSVPQPLPATGR
jgi:hypothetical protein